MLQQRFGKGCSKPHCPLSSLMKPPLKYILMSWPHSSAFGLIGLAPDTLYLQIILPLSAFFLLLTSQYGRGIVLVPKFVNLSINVEQFIKSKCDFAVVSLGCAGKLEWSSVDLEECDITAGDVPGVRLCLLT